MSYQPPQRGPNPLDPSTLEMSKLVELRRRQEAQQAAKESQLNDLVRRRIDLERRVSMLVSENDQLKSTIQGVRARVVELEERLVHLDSRSVQFDKVLKDIDRLGGDANRSQTRELANALAERAVRSLESARDEISAAINKVLSEALRRISVSDEPPRSIPFDPFARAQEIITRNISMTANYSLHNLE